ncbi:T9SS type A sorting domain-containing protein [Aureibaculum algae]|uniref:T9SS type A sorting domain-containing protein n=1 Tax=Aureibaculum algae TaxID=2584122 RepID=A0A5B7TSC5_9FLAO|nr:T9SS type A sorting domain-containing protein [Aureibaculum algae]QCX39705.1 T9SS type A sorting domain-containing protein [Aureibaculum algae]
MRTILTLLMLTSIIMTSAQTIDKQVVASGGETIINGDNSLTFTVGEPVMGKIGSGVTINQGFLAGAALSSTLAVDEQLLSSAIKVYPNPVSDNLKIDFTDVAGKTKVVIYNSTGQIVRTEKLSTQNNSLDLSQLQNGLYLVNLHFSDYKTVKTFKIIKK